MAHFLDNFFLIYKFINMLVYKFINIRYSLFKVILVQKYFRKSENMHHVFKHSFCCIQEEIWSLKPGRLIVPTCVKHKINGV